ncbi:MAG: hypothetical protein JWM95_1304 [Gemmatimonadetes bacterium]|nr:hypothetical protein [Gemmatimonadota bacterium]
MRRILQLSALCLTMGTLSACSTPETVLVSDDIPSAGVRFIHAVPDTIAMDLRAVDIVENGQFQIGFRNNPVTTAGVTASSQIEFKNARAGSRHFRLFLDGTTAAIASTVIKDTTLTLTAGKNYTFLLMGSAKAGTMKLSIIEESVPDPVANVGLRVINATSGSLDFRQYPSTGTLPAAATWAAVPAYSVSAFQTAAVGQIKINAQPVGGGTALFDALALLGTLPTGQGTTCGGTAVCDLEGTPGTTVAGSAVTAIAFPASTPGTGAVQFAAPGVSFMWDKRPPRPAGT